MSSLRERLIFFLFFFFFAAIIARLGWWQIFQRQTLLAQAQAQGDQEKPLLLSRGKILFNDHHFLAFSKTGYNLHIFKPALKITNNEIAQKLSAISPLAKTDKEKTAEKERINNLLDSSSLWIPIWERLDKDDYQTITTLEVDGLRLEEEMDREYPEGSPAAQLVGFLGKNTEGKDQGYFGLEGYYDQELKEGTNLNLFLDRQLQWIAEKQIARGVKKYGAQKGLVIISNPQNGGILAMATYPSFDPLNYSQADPQLFINPAISQTIEPGSIFKPLIMTAALDSGTVKPNDTCPSCDGPRKIGQYTIHTWNDKYYPQSTITEIIQHSDNVGMVYVVEKLGLKKTLAYLKLFGIGQRTGIDLQGEATNQLDEKGFWPFIDLATISFGQGIAITPIQMVQAIGAIANQGKLVRPRVVKEVDNGKELRKTKLEEKQIITPEAAEEMKAMLVNAVENGYTQKIKITGAKIAGKTGTAQIPLSGHYDPQKTIASFVGLAPAANPQFTMLVILYQPTTSSWGAETAAPLWFDIAQDIFLTTNINPK